MSGIYQIYNPINNKRYIGSSINVERRLKEHLRNLEKNRLGGLIMACKGGSKKGGKGKPGKTGK